MSSTFVKSDLEPGDSVLLPSCMAAKGSIHCHSDDVMEAQARRPEVETLAFTPMSHGSAFSPESTGCAGWSTAHIAQSLSRCDGG